jgi:hypothetical protein
MTDNEKLAAEQAAGLRALADMIEANQPLAQQFSTHFKYLAMHVFDGPDRVFPMFIRAALAHGATVTKDFNEKFAKVMASWGDSFCFALQTDRELVCERVVVGTETVTRKVKDPDALAAVPEVEVTEEVEKVEYRCTPLLGAEGVASS